MARCRDCEAPVIWATNADTGRNFMLDEAPNPKGKFVFINGKCRKQTLEDVTLLRPTYTCHWDTCESKR